MKKFTSKQELKNEIIGYGRMLSITGGMLGDKYFEALWQGLQVEANGEACAEEEKLTEREGIDSGN